MQSLLGGEKLSYHHHLTNGKRLHSVLMSLSIVKTMQLHFKPLLMLRKHKVQFGVLGELTGMVELHPLPLPLPLEEDRYYLADLGDGGIEAAVGVPQLLLVLRSLKAGNKPEKALEQLLLSKQYVPLSIIKLLTHHLSHLCVLVECTSRVRCLDLVQN